eukprot:TRINITY_DN16669_c0_g1_i1.p1 TRINITY_DN16669_c0_g1~~TRINITY_DN16669_c0_g1_i1.p1  ORF type:complete len:335 (-),score=35.77 TRINITY_DN16669_c0_g1_i1:45-1049(-)
MAVVLDTPGADIWQDGLLARMTSPHDQLRLLLRLRPLIQGRMLAKVLQFTERLSGGEAINSLCCATFWSVDPAFGWCLQNMLSVLVSAVAIAKVAFRGPRPMWLSGSVRLTDKVLQESLTAYGFPSGHVTGAIVFYGLVFATKAPVSTPAKCAAVTSVATCVGLARMLAMAHLPVDVIGAVPLGLLVLPPCIHFTQRYLKKPKTKHDPVRPSKRIASANLAVGCALLLVALRLLNPRHTRWASKDLTLAIGITIATGLSHLMLLTQRGLKFYPHHGELSIGTRASRLALGLLGQLAGYGVLKVARSRSLVSTPCLLYTSPSPRDRTRSRMPSSA